MKVRAIVVTISATVLVAAAGTVLYPMSQKDAMRRVVKELIQIQRQDERKIREFLQANPLVRINDTGSIEKAVPFRNNERFERRLTAPTEALLFASYSYKQGPWPCTNDLQVVTLSGKDAPGPTSEVRSWSVGKSCKPWRLCCKWAEWVSDELEKEESTRRENGAE